MALKSAAGSSSPLGYFTYTGWVIVVVLSVTVWVRKRLGEYGWMFTWQMIVVAAMTVAYAAFIMLRERHWFELAHWRSSVARLRLAASHSKVRPRERRFVVWRAARIPRAWMIWFAAMPGADILRRWQIWFAAMPGAELRSRLLAQTWGWLRTSLTSLPSLAYLLVALALLWLDNRRYVIVIALLEAVAVCALRQPTSLATRTWLVALGLASWGLTSGLTFTHLADWLLNGDPSTGLAVVGFAVSFVVVLKELSADTRERENVTVRLIVCGVALSAFAMYALRTDHLLAEWVPIHRSYFADVAQSVRDGQWLLWDVPSLYGFLSILCLAVIPASNAWQALYELTALFLLFQSAVTFTILRWGRAGWSNVAFAIAFPLAADADSLSRYAWNARLYPQGGLRFFWTVDLLLIVFLMYAWRAHNRRVLALRYAGHFVWLFALLWSLENAIWASVVWLPYVVLEALVLAPVSSLRAFAMRLLHRAWPIFALPLLAFATIETTYRLRLGHLPDWRAYAEFTALFAAGGVRPIFHVQGLGAAWSILIVLGAIGALGIAALRLHRWDVIPLLGATWLAVWATSSYYALEPLDLYVELLMSVLVPASAIVVFVAREALLGEETALFARLSIAPLAIISIAVSFGEPSRLAAMTMPFMPAWHFDSTNAFPAISGELGQLMATAAIRPDDKVLFPTGPYWTELDQGLILPFTRLPDGTVVEYHSWLPTSPSGPQELLESLPPDRRQVYVERYLDRTQSAGWLIAYRGAPNCGQLSPRLRSVRTYSSINFSASLCELLAAGNAEPTIPRARSLRERGTR